MPTQPGQVSAVDHLKLPSLQVLGQQLRNDRDARDVGMLWLKYMNYGPDSNAHAVHVTWYGDFVQGTVSNSADAGHIHVSSRSDAWGYDIGSYDPVARTRGAGTPSIDSEVTLSTLIIAKDVPNGTYFKCDGITSQPIDSAHIGDIKYLAGQGAFTLAHGTVGAEWIEGGYVRAGWNEATFGALVKPAVLALTDAQLSSMAATIGDHLASTLPGADAQALETVVESALRDVLKTGVGA
jgi:hypothetical protein